ncbi:MAG: thiol reductant ABC exporter subunit CydC, partial [Pseudomonas formosensis]|nr:thiol reductant ABC exporter subunit CydC [Halopseudomonas formosensis]
MTEGHLRLRLSRLLHSRAAGWLLALLLGALALFSAIALLALSGWFITAAALAGMATGYMLDVFRPAAIIRLLALTRTLGRYGERLASHQAALGLLRDLRSAVFRRISHARQLPRRSNEAMHRLVADIDLLDQFPLRVLL